MLAGYCLFTSGVLMIIVIIKYNFQKIGGVTYKELIMYDEQYESYLFITAPHNALDYRRSDSW